MRRPTLPAPPLGGHDRHADRTDTTRPTHPRTREIGTGPTPSGRSGAAAAGLSPAATPLPLGAPGVSPRLVARHVTDEPAQLLKTVPEGRDPHPEVLLLAQRIASRLSLPRPRRDTSTGRGFGELRSLRFSGGSDDIDLDATLDRLVEHPVPEDDDIIVRERIRTRRSVVLVVDTSGSMRGERVRTAAATVGALVVELARDEFAVIAFWSDAAVLARFGQHVSAAQVIDTLLRTPAHGLTNISFPLEVARQELPRLPARDCRVLLLSDCVHNAGPDPRTAAARLPRVDVLLDASQRARSRPGPGSRPRRARPSRADARLPRCGAGDLRSVRPVTRGLARQA